VVRARRRQYVRVPRILKQNVGVRCLLKNRHGKRSKLQNPSRTTQTAEIQRCAFAFDTIYPMKIFIGSRGNLHRLKGMGTFTAARSKATEPNLPLK
jgi:hypothetical protein